MIIDTIAVENFGVYAGRQEITLTPVSARKPITLVGGLNGRGKTTLLDAVQLCLYGKFSNCSNRGTLAYGEYLRQCSHRHNQSTQTAVELQFRQILDGREVHYKVRREWPISDGLPSENFHIERDGVSNELMAENWTEVVETIVPRRIAEFFFFDGEKIESYASKEKASALLRSALINLLGIDLVDQLNADLDIVKARKAKEIPDESSRLEFAAAQDEVERLARQKAAEVDAMTGLRTHDLRDLDKRLEGVELEFSKSGGDLFDRTSEIESQLAAAQAEFRSSEKDLLQLAFSELPLALIKGTLLDAERQGHLEHLAANSAALVELLEERDASILKILRKHPSASAAEKDLKAFIGSDIARRRSEAEVQGYLDITPTTLHKLMSLSKNALPDKERQLAEAVAHFELIERRQAKLESEKSGIPTNEAISNLMSDRAWLRSEKASMEQKIAQHMEEVDRLDTWLGRAKQSLARLAEAKVRDEVAKEDCARTIDHANRVQKTLTILRSRAISAHVQRIEGLIADSFRHLLGKEDLFETLRISPEDFTVQLTRADGTAIPPERLSAGERQLFAVAMLWGLAKAAGRVLPTIIDTPLGRLDSVHRGKLVTRYFPSASHQILLLSTDEEIGSDYLEMIKPAVGRYYLLRYDDLTKSSQIQKGYFGKELENAA